RPVTQLDVFPVIRGKEVLEAAELLELLPVEHRRTASRKCRVQRLDRTGAGPVGRDIDRVETYESAGKASQLPGSDQTVVLHIEHAAMNSEYLRFIEVIGEGRNRIGTYLHVIIDQQYKVMCGLVEPAVAGGAKPGVALVLDEVELDGSLWVGVRGESGLSRSKALSREPFTRLIDACVVDDQYLDRVKAVASLARGGFEYR